MEAVFGSPGFGLQLDQRWQVHHEEFGALILDRLAVGDQLFEAAAVDQRSKAIERSETRRQEHVTVAEEGRFLWGKPTIGKLTYAGVQLV